MAGLFFEIIEPGNLPRRATVRVDLTIGREFHNDVVVNDSKVSGSHAKIIQKDDDFYLVDLGSSNRTHIFDGPSLSENDEWKLTVGVRFKVGQVEFVVCESPEEEGEEEPKKPAVKPLSPLELPRDGALVGPILAPHSGLAPGLGPDSGITSEEEFPEFDTKTLRVLGEPLPEKTDDVESTLVSIPAVDPPSSPESVEAEQLASEAGACHSEERTSTNRIADILPDAESEAKTTNLDLQDLAPISDLKYQVPWDGKGPDPDEETIFSSPPPPRMPHADEQADTDKVAPSRVVDPNGATVLSPNMSPNASADTVRSEQGAPLACVDSESADATVVSQTPAPKESPGVDSFVSSPTDTPAENAALEQRLAMMRPRLIFCHADFKDCRFITKNNFSIGRASDSKAESVDCALSHENVSAKHAVVIHREGRFFLEDCGSRNGTAVDGSRLQVMKMAELRLDTWIMIGDVQALFVTDRDRFMNEPDHGFYHGALGYLVTQRLVPTGLAENLWRACTKENQHPGEKLVLEGRISVKQWREALVAAKSGELPPVAPKSKWKPLAILTFLAALVVIALLLLEFGLIQQLHWGQK